MKEEGKKGGRTGSLEDQGHFVAPLGLGDQVLEVAEAVGVRVPDLEGHVDLAVELETEERMKGEGGE